MTAAEDSEQDKNVASRLRVVASRQPSEVAIAVATDRYEPGRKRKYSQTTFAELEIRTSSIAAGLQELGVKPGMRIVMLVKFGPDFIALVFALLKVGAVVVLIDPGMGRKNLLKCLVDTEPDGFVAIPAAQAIRALMRRRFPKAKVNVTVGPTFGVLPKPTLAQLEGTPSALFVPPPISDADPAAIIFTTGSTGPPKGVLYTHKTFNNQVDQLVEHYGIAPGGCDLSGFPLFGLFNAMMGTTTIIPDMDPTRPADVDPQRLLDAIDQWKVTQAFGSPALWTTVGRWAAEHGRTVASLRRIYSAGAPVAPHILQRMREMMQGEGEMYTPYGATEALPVASIESREVLEETGEACNQGAGTCVGARFPGIQWKIVEIQDGPADRLDALRELPAGEIGELVVSGAVVTETYVTRMDQNPLHKLQDGERIWHRMGDVGYLDSKGRFWCCGRKSHRVLSANGLLFTEPCEAVYNNHPWVHRCALVGIDETVGGESGTQRPVVIVEPWSEKRPKDSVSEQQLVQQLLELGGRFEHTSKIQDIFVYPERLPTDIRHNSKIFREQLRPWAMQQLAK